MEEPKINIFKFVINPKDFAQSVENIFYLSFLIRDGQVAFETEDGEPVICRLHDIPIWLISLTYFYPDMCEPPSDEDYQGGLKKQQMVLEFDMATWSVSLAYLTRKDNVLIDV